MSVLVIGYGNPAREDDGLGPALIERLEKMGMDGVALDADYQLTVEDAANIADYDVVVFVDAAVKGNDPYEFYPLTPKQLSAFSTHSVGPEEVLGLACDLFYAKTEAYMLAIRGYSFEMYEESPTDKALKNLECAIQFIVPVLKEQSFKQALLQKQQ
jgi:hydrogenase maturation protease